MSDFLCAACGAGHVSPVTRPGRRARYGDVYLPVPDDFEIPTCDHCGEEWFDEETGERLDEVLRQTSSSDTALKR